MSKPLTDLTGFGEAVRQLWQLSSPCVLCPRRCRAKRSDGQIDFCGIGELPLVSSVGPHYGEESVLVGPGGSGTIFFAGCNLGCVFCQNYDISHYNRQGRSMTVKQLAKAMLALQQHGCSNVNLVTPTHVSAPIAAAIEVARKDGLTLPIVYNCGGYESVETLRLLEGFVDILIPNEISVSCSDELEVLG
jgi:putative pyruvate formate lyase activating enzyme